MSAVMVEQVQFDRTESALRFAFAQNRENYQAAIINRMAGAPGSQGRGLGGLEGAAMAGIIRGHVTRLGYEFEAILSARYMEREEPCHHCCNPNEFWHVSEGRLLTRQFIGAVEDVMHCTQAAVAGTISNFRFRKGVVLKHFGVKVHLGRLAEKCQIPDRTAGDQISKIKSYLQKKEGAAFHAISANLRQAGIVTGELDQ